MIHDLLLSLIVDKKASKKITVDDGGKPKES